MTSKHSASHSASNTHLPSRAAEAQRASSGLARPEPNRPSSRPGPRNRAVLFVLTGPQQGSLFELHGSRVWLGRDSAELNLNDNAVSARHVQVTRRADGIYVQDNGSRNGTFVNDERVEQPRRLVDGDHLSIGNTILAERIRHHVETMRFPVGTGCTSVTVSVGIAALPPTDVDIDAEALLQAADEALYAAKQAGRNRVRIGRIGLGARGAHRSAPLTSPPRESALTPASALLDCRPPPVPRFD